MKIMNAGKNRKYLAARILCGLLLGAYLTGGYCMPVAWADVAKVDGNVTFGSGVIWASAWGHEAKVYGHYSTAWGSGTAGVDGDPTKGQHATAFGYWTTASGDGASAFGGRTTASGNLSTSFGETTTASEYASTAFGYWTTASGAASTAFGYNTTAEGMSATAFGYNTKASGNNATAFGFGTEASGNNATAFGQGTRAIGLASTAFGFKSEAIGKNSTAFGDSSKALAENSLAALGGTTEAAATNSAAIGNGATVSAADSFAFGNGASATVEGGVALGSGSEATVAGGIAGYDPSTGVASTKTTGAWQSTNAAIAVGKADGSVTRQIIGVAAGMEDTDAVNVAQLKAVAADTVYTAGDGIDLTDKKISVKADASDFKFDSGALSLKKDGAVASGNTGVVTGGTVFTETRVAADGNYIIAANSAAANLKALDNQVKSNTDAIGTTEDGTFVKASNSVGENLNALDTQVASLSSVSAAEIDALHAHISDVDGKVEKVGAGAAALAALHPLDTDSKFGIAAGFGNYRSANAMALGLFYRPTDKVMFSIGGSMGNGENLMNVGVSFALDKGVTTSKAAMARKIAAQEEKLSQQDAKIQSLEAENAKLAERLAAIEAKLAK